LPGYQEPRPLVFVSLYPEDAGKYDELKRALAKLRLNDSALQIESDFSEVLGRGFKVGFLGKLHFEITVERLQRELNIAVVTSFPSVAYMVHRKQIKPNEIKHGSALSQNSQESTHFLVTNPKDFPNDYLEVLEPVVRVEILTPPAYLGAILQLKELFRFSNLQTQVLNNKILITAKLPLADLISDLDDKLKSASAGYASLNYDLIGFEKADVVKMDILLMGQIVPGLSRIIPREKIEYEGRFMVEKLKDLLPKQQYVQAIQAAVGTKIIARENIPALHKLLGYFGKTGGDRTRKMKLWKKQQKGKKKLKEMASQSQIKIPANIFKELLKK